MSKALVIRGANFSINKVETITLANPIPCEGISISQNTISATKLGIVGTLTATPTPSDTTDDIVWTSSNESVATVSNGVVTIVGIGTATITATCGSYSATCAVSSAISLSASDLEFDFEKIISTSSQISDWMSINDASVTTRSYAVITSPDITQSGYKSFVNSDTSGEAIYGEYPIMIPQNATQITISAPSVLYGISGFFTDSTKHPDDKVNGVKMLYQPSTIWGTSGTINIPEDMEGIDSFVLTLTFKSITDTPPSNFTIVFS